MSELELGVTDEHQKEVGDAGAKGKENGESSSGGVKREIQTSPPVSDLQQPLIGKQERDIEQGGEEEEENEALEEIDNILWVKGVQPTHANRCKEALKSWRRKDELFTSRIDRKRKQSSDFQNEVYQLLGFYSVFQGVLLTAVAQSNLLHCNNTWTATLLSALASFVCIIGVVLKLRKIRELEHTIANEELTRRALVSWQLRLWESGEKFDFKDAVAPKDQKGEQTSWWLNASFLAIAVVLILFSVAFVVSIRQILCNPGHTLLPGSG
ncbi:hypothetical protein M758_8G068600 [Ceratodon purpureus]|nr:hypothetical protein M758_8G068600 [Ceratodon purpureus]